MLAYFSPGSSPTETLPAACFSPPLVLHRQRSPLVLCRYRTEKMTEGQSEETASAPEGVSVLRRNSDDVGWEYGVLVDINNKDKGFIGLKQHITQEGKNAKKCQGMKTTKEKLLEAQEKCKKALYGAKRKREVKTVPISFNVCDNDEFKQMCEAIGQFGPRIEPPTMFDLRGRLLEEEYVRTKSLLQEREAEKMKNGCSIMADAWSDKKRRSIMNFYFLKRDVDVSHTSEVVFELVDKAIEDIGPDDVVQVVTANASNNMGAKKLLHVKRPHIFWTSCATHTINLMLQGIGNMPRFKKVIDQAKAFTIFVYGHTRTLECMRYFTEGKEIVRPGVTRFASNYLTLDTIQEKKDQLRNMVVHSRWDSLKDVKSKKGKNATTTILNPTFWKDVKLTLAVFAPLFKVLRLVDGDVKPSMGFVYGEILKAKRHVKEALGNVENRFKDVVAVIDKKMAGRLDSPLHLATYFLNPHYSYADPSFFDVPKITEGFINCVETFYYHDDEMQEQASNIELQKFQNREGPFSKKLARTFENFDYNPASWWRLYGTETPALQKMATKILSLTASSSGCERNWSGFDGVHTKKRNRLTTDHLNKLVYIQFNNRLINNRANIKSKKITDVLLSSGTTEAQGFLQENGDDYALVSFRDDEDEEEVMEGTGIPWSVLGDAVGAEEQLELRRSARVRELNEEEFESEEEEFDEDGDEDEMDET
ncbi:hAT transposon superfamily protein [Zea mays]|uniref:HAT transposon superfamily protein n=1 Tax=Zea mays TaxID=4577 RepID=A0A1D6FS51_MAIZE|nr:hAT transposon superfamily protein [Zea mays]